MTVPVAPAPPSPRRPLAAVVIVVTVLVVVVVLVVGVAALVSDTDETEVVRAPDAPADLCAVIGLDDLQEWVPEAEWVRDSDANSLNTESSCRDEGGLTEDLTYASLTARVYRYGWIDDPDSAEEQAVESIEASCATAFEPDAGLGDDSCFTYVEEDSSGTGRAAIEVRQGADLISVSYYANPATEDQARERALTAATRIATAVRR